MWRKIIIRMARRLMLELVSSDEFREKLKELLESNEYFKQMPLRQRATIFNKAHESLQYALSEILADAAK